MVRANFYGEHYDERGTINGSLEDDGVTISPGSVSSEIDAIVYIDAEVSYQFSDELNFKLGFSNLFDEFIGEIDSGANGTIANRQSVGLQYPRRSAANYEGGSWYLSASYEL